MAALWCRSPLPALLLCSPAVALFTLELLVTREVQGAVYPVRSKWTGESCANATAASEPRGESEQCICVGGAARSRQYIQPPSVSSNTVALDMGAFFSGSGRFFSAFGGNVSASIFKSAGYAAFGLTYRDFTAGGEAGLANYLQLVGSKAVVSNLAAVPPGDGDASLSALIEPFTLVPLADGRMLAVLSLTDPTHLVVSLPAYEDRFLGFRRALVVALAELHRNVSHLPDVIAVMISDVPLTAAEVEEAGSVEAVKRMAVHELVDEAVLTAAAALDLLFEHMATPMPPPLSASHTRHVDLILRQIGIDIFVLGGFAVGTEEPYVRKNWAGEDVLVVPQRGALSYGAAIYNITATFTDDGFLFTDMEAAGAAIIELDCSVPPHPPTAAYVEENQIAQQRILGAAVGTLAAPLDSVPSFPLALQLEPNGSVQASSPTALTGCILTLQQNVVCGCRVSSCKQGALVTDAVMYAAGTDVALFNSGSIRTTLAAGTVTHGDVMAMLPFANECSRALMSGAVIRSALAHSISGLSDADVDPPGLYASGRFLQVSSSLKFDWYFAGGRPELSVVHVWIAGVWTLLNDTATYTVATYAYLLDGGDDYTMFRGVKATSLGITTQAVMAAYLASSEGPYQTSSLDRIRQQPDLVIIELGVACSTHRAGSSVVPLKSAREECDHVHHVIDRINDKTDGFLDELLPNARIVTAEVMIGCVETPPLGPTAVAALQAALPNMLAIVGPLCSDDVKDITNVEFRATSGFEAIVLSGVSSAPSIGNEAAYPNVARLTSSESAASASLVALFGWQRVAVIHDDSVWATEAAHAFIKQHTGRKGGSTADIVNAGDEISQGFAVAEFDNETIDIVGLLRRLEELDAKVVYMVAQPRVQRAIWAASYESGHVYGEGYAWITAWPSEDAFLNEDGTVASAAQQWAHMWRGACEMAHVEVSPLHPEP